MVINNQQTWKNSPHPAHVKLAKAERAPVQVLENDGGNQEAGDDEENVNTYEAAFY